MKFPFFFKSHLYMFAKFANNIILIFSQEYQMMSKTNWWMTNNNFRTIYQQTNNYMDGWEKYFSKGWPCKNVFFWKTQLHGSSFNVPLMNPSWMSVNSILGMSQNIRKDHNLEIFGGASCESTWRVLFNNTTFV